MKAASFFALAFIGPAAIAAPPSDADFPRDVLSGIDDMKQLPAQGFHVVESKGRLLLVSTNGHYVVVEPRLLDLWNGVEVKAVKDVKATERIPLAKMGITAQKLGGITVGDASSTSRVTVFMDPGSPESRKVLPRVRELASKHSVDIVFVPALGERANTSRALICDTAAAHQFIKSGQVPAPVPPTEKCGVRELERARVTVSLLGIQLLPFTIAPNGATLSGTPDEYSKFIAANLE